MDRATETCMLLLELECGDAVVDALLKGSAHKVPKLALACVEAMRVSVKEFGVPVVVPPKPMLKGIAPLFDSKDAKVRGAAKDLTVELTRWLGHDAVRRDLIEKMRGTMQAEVQAAADAIEIGRAVRQRLTRKEAANPPAPDTAVDHVDAMDVDGGDGAVASAATTNGDVKLPDAYEFADPESILDVLEKQPKDKETPKFWDAVNSSKWNQRLDAMTRLKELADAPRLASGDYGDVARALKKIVTKDANIACVGEACAAAGALAKGLRKEWTREAKVLLPGMLDKLKDKNTSVVQKNQDALLLFSTHCFSLADVADDVLAALSHKMPKVPQQTMLWIAAACGEMKGAPAAAALAGALVAIETHKLAAVKAASLRDESEALFGIIEGGVDPKAFVQRPFRHTYASVGDWSACVSAAPSLVQTQIAKTISKGDLRWSVWDVIDMDCRDGLTLRGFIERFEREVGLQCGMVSHGASLLYADFMNRAKIKERLESPLASAMKLGEDATHATLSVGACDENDDDVDIPEVRVRFR